MKVMATAAALPAIGKDQPAVIEMAHRQTCAGPFRAVVLDEDGKYGQIDGAEEWAAAGNMSDTMRVTKCHVQRQRDLAADAVDVEDPWCAISTEPRPLEQLTDERSDRSNGNPAAREEPVASSAPIQDLPKQLTIDRWFGTAVRNTRSAENW
jgi:hypothetical protein